LDLGALTFRVVQRIQVRHIQTAVPRRTLGL